MIANVEEDDGFEDCVYGGMRPNYKIPILLTDLKEETLDGIFQEPSNRLACAKCDFWFHQFSDMKEHFDTCSGEPNEDGHAMEYRASQYYTNMLIMSLKEMYEAGTSGTPPSPTSPEHLPFYMESNKQLNINYHNRVNGKRTMVTCQMCGKDYIHEVIRKKRYLYLDDMEDEWRSTITIVEHVPECSKYKKEFEKFQGAINPYVYNVQFHYHNLFQIYELIRNGIYGSGFKNRATSKSAPWRKMTTIYEDDETQRRAELPKRQLLIKITTLHHIEPEYVGFIRKSYLSDLDEVVGQMFFTKVTGLKQEDL